MENLRILAEQITQTDHTVKEGGYSLYSVSKNLTSMNDYCRFLTKTKYKRSSLNQYCADSFPDSSREMDSLELLSLCFRPFGPHSSSNVIGNVEPSVIHYTESIVDHLGYQKKKKHIQTFFNGSAYFGEWNSLGMAGKGSYKYPHGVVYDGNFNENGQCHGNGTLMYPNGYTLYGIWENGKLNLSSVNFDLSSQNIEKKSDLVDRRYPAEMDNDFGSPGYERITNQHPPPPIPSGCYDVRSGIYVPSKKYTITQQSLQKEKEPSYEKWEDLVQYDVDTLELIDSIKCKKEDCFIVEDVLVKSLNEDNDYIVRDIPTKSMSAWIQKFARSTRDNPVGYMPQLYEVYTTGATKHLENLKKHPFPKSYYYEEPPNNLVIKSQQSRSNMMFAVRPNKKPTRARRKTLLEEISKIKRITTIKTRRPITIDISNISK